mgnify:CR=1 FL=1
MSPSPFRLPPSFSGRMRPYEADDLAEILVLNQVARPAVRSMTAREMQALTATANVAYVIEHFFWR